MIGFPTVKPDSKEYTLAVLGLWHLGSVYSACFSEMGYSVVGVDTRDRVVALNDGLPPVYEQGLSELLKKNVERGRLSFTSDLRRIGSCHYAILAIDTPIDTSDKPNLRPVYDLGKRIAPHLGEGCHVMVSSQVPVGTCERLARLMKLTKKGVTISYVPENLRLGNALESFFFPTMVVVGSDSVAGLDSTAFLFRGLDAEVVRMPLRGAEMFKHALNSYLALNVSFGNEMAEICQVLGINPTDVISAVMKDSRVSPRAPMKPGPPFSGGTLARDLNAIRKIGRNHGVRTAVLDGVASANNRRKAEIMDAIVAALGGAPKKKTVAVLGLTYKAGTDTLRRSFSIETVNRLLRLGARIRTYDPKVNWRSKKDVEVLASAYDAAKGADLTVIFTPWPEFASLDFLRLRKEVKKPIIIDLPRMLDRNLAAAAGLRLLEV